jgi:hypothetical protein
MVSLSSTVAKADDTSDSVAHAARAMHRPLPVQRGLVVPTQLDDDFELLQAARRRTMPAPKQRTPRMAA